MMRIGLRSAFISAFSFLVIPLSSFAQSQFHYRFKSSEHLHYHFKVDSKMEYSSGIGEQSTEGVFEADPDWQVREVDMDGIALVLLEMQHRIVNGDQVFDLAHYTPASMVEISTTGGLLYGKILVDDTLRNSTKAILAKYPQLRLLRDKEALELFLPRVWPSLDTLSLDTNGKLYVRTFDSIVSEPSERDTTLWGKLGVYPTATRVMYHHKGKALLTLKDTVLGKQHFWLEHIVTDGESYEDDDKSAIPYHDDADILFRKSDDLIQIWSYILESHGDTFKSHVEMTMKLTSIDGD